MEGDSEVCRFYWQVDNPFLPDEEREAMFCFRSPILMKWKAALKLVEEGKTLSKWPVSFSLQHLPLDDGHDNVVAALPAFVSVNFVNIRNDIPERVPVVFNNMNNYTHTCNLFISPQHGKLDIEIEIAILDQEVLYPKIDLEPLMVLSEDLGRLLSDHLYCDRYLQSIDPGKVFPVHSYILDARWSHFFRKVKVEQSTVNTPIRPDVLKDILTYLYTGSTKHFHSVNRDFGKRNKYHTELMQIIDKYRLHYLYMIFKPEPNRQRLDMKTSLSSAAVTFRLEKAGKLGLYAWKHSPLSDVSVETLLKFDLVQDNPTFSYSMRFKSEVKLSVRVNLVYRRKIIELGKSMETVVYEGKHEVPCEGGTVTVENIAMEGNIDHLKEFIVGNDRVEGEYEVEHSFRFVLHLSDGGRCLQVPRMLEVFNEELTSLRILSKDMSLMQKLDVEKKLETIAEGGNSDRLHKGIFAVRIPNWRNAIEDAPTEGNIPDSVKCTVSNDALPFLIEYLYTATCAPTQRDVINNISTFAQRCGFSSLASDIHLLGFRAIYG